MQPGLFWHLERKGAAGHRAFGATVGHADSYGWGLGVAVGNWGIGCKRVAIGARISNACEMSWKHRGGCGTNSFARA